MSVYSPSEALPLISISNPKKFSRDSELYESGSIKSPLHVDRFKIDRKPFSVQFDAILDCDRILTNQFDGKTSFSLYVIPEQESDSESFEKLNDILSSTFPLDGWSSTSSWKDDRLHLKLKYTPGTMQPFVSFDIPVNLKKPHEFKISHGQKVRVVGSLSYYYNLERQLYGTTFNASSIQFSFE